MNRDIVVKAEGIGKRYRLGELHRSYSRLSEAIAERAKRVRGSDGQHESLFWALRELSFEVRQGETFGIVGHNGAGKSTLLKIISRVTPPTNGTIRLRGRVGTLLEVGTGFHPELTGRENIYLNGAILGMGKSEIDAKFDEIVGFAEVERFIDTPVKRYSSGMYLRLAFAVAAHLEPEILIVDEVLSVGDLVFQEKCLGRMQAVAREGRTVVFVSHNLAAVSALCERAMLLSGGRRVVEGPTGQVIEEYVRSVRTGGGTNLADRTDRHGSGRLRFQEVALEAEGGVIDSPATGQSFDFVLRYDTADSRPLRNVDFAVQVMTTFGQVFLHLNTKLAGIVLRDVPPQGEIRCTLPRCPLPAGQYTVTLWADTAGDPLDWVERAFELTVQEGDFFGSGQTLRPSHQAVLVDHSWSVLRRAGAAPSPEPVRM